MITESDLKEAIAECQGQRNPNASTCIKMAAYLIIQREMFGKADLPSYSFSSGPPVGNSEELIIGYHGDSEFLQAIDGKGADGVWQIMDELMESMAVLQPRIYDQVLRKVHNLE